MIVRLKDHKELIKLMTTLMFQFYDSPIKRVCCFGNTRIEATFQFYDSPIKSFNEEIN